MIPSIIVFIKPWFQCHYAPFEIPALYLWFKNPYSSLLPWTLKSAPSPRYHCEAPSPDEEVQYLVILPYTRLPTGTGHPGLPCTVPRAPPALYEGPAAPYQPAWFLPRVNNVQFPAITLPGKRLATQSQDLRPHSNTSSKVYFSSRPWRPVPSPL